jgi:hypothetical protein
MVIPIMVRHIFRSSADDGSRYIPKHAFSLRWRSSQPQPHKLFNMGVSLSTAKLITTSTFAYDFLVQQWAIALSKPDMKVVNDRNPGAFSPM